MTSSTSGINPLTGLPQDFADLGELTPTEENQIQSALLAAQNAHTPVGRGRGGSFPPEEEENRWNAFAREVRNRLGEVGFVADIQWEEFEADNFPGAKAATPNITIIGRTAKKEVDHDLIKRELGEGLDGRPGYIREDGSVHLDPIKKTL